MDGGTGGEQRRKVWEEGGRRGGRVKRGVQWAEMREGRAGDKGVGEGGVVWWGGRKGREK